MKKLKDDSDRNSCPDEIKINRYVLHQCSSEERREIEAHLVMCPFCRSEVVFMIKTQPEIQDDKKCVEFPEHLHNKGMDFLNRMVKGHGSALEILLRFFREQWEIVRHTGTVITQPVFAAREETQEKKAIISSIVKEFNEFQVIVDVKQGVEGSIDLQVTVKKSKEEILVPQVLFTLWDQKKKRILEEFTRDGEIIFEGLIPGVYSIRIVQKERNIGEIILDLRG